MKDAMSGPILCSEIDQKDPNIHCYIGKTDGIDFKKISDDRVRIENLHFFLSGNAGESLTNLSQE